MQPAPQRFAAQPVTDWMAHLLAQSGMPQRDAQDVAGLIVRTEARGFATHGVVRLPSYLEKIASGEYNARAVVTVTRQPGGVCRLDGDGALGQLAGLHAMRSCIDMVAEAPVAMCFARDLGHLGAVGIFPLLAAEQGLVAIAIQRTAPILAMPGSTGPLLGHNPIAFAAPVPGAAPIVFDMASSVAARGHILLAAARGEPIPQGWALDAHGQPTTDAQAAADGMLLPTGGHKGLGIAMLGELLAGSLSASMDDRDNLRAAKRGAGAHGGSSAFFCVLNPDLVGDRTTFETLVGDWTGSFRAHAGETARLPGHRAALAERSALQQGLPIDPHTVQRLRELGRQHGVPFPASNPRSD
ncbi:MAG: Ldh family oxidoreductase [Rhodoferax sp.]|nr:Ldh family oxidoreductase [Rhodoferax sp.]MCB2039612.1 Ldh family oxidoreductase [Rhodoferax sp.]